MDRRRAHIFYSGWVQGVGFRWTTRNIANRFELTGWVRNNPDGRVECICEGPEEKINSFLEEMDREFPTVYIKDKEIDWLDATGEFDEFRIIV
jgi:acylphosphatase